MKSSIWQYLQPVSFPHQVFPLLPLPEKTDTLTLRTAVTITISRRICLYICVCSFVLLYSSSVVQRFWNYIRQPLRVSTPLHFSDLPLSLSLPFPLSLLLDLVKWQDVFLLFTGRFAVPTLWALYEEGSNKISRTKVREVQVVSMGVKQHVLFSGQCLLTLSLLLVLTLMTGSPLDLSITTVLSLRPAKQHWFY